MVSVIKKLSVLIWKSLKFRQRSLIYTAVEILCPIVVIYLFHYLFNVAARPRPPGEGNNTAEVQYYMDSTKYYTNYTGKTDQISLNKTGIINTHHHLNSDTNYNNTYDSLTVNDIMEKAVSSFEKLDMSLFHSNIKQTLSGRKNIEQYNNFMEKNIYSLFSGIEFLKIERENRLLEYKINRNYKERVIKSPMNWYFKSRTFFEYDNTLVSTVQKLLDLEILKNIVGEVRYQIDLETYPVQDSNNSSAIGNIKYMALYYFLMIAYVFLLVSILKDVLEEKESGIKELTKTMGVSGWMIWFQWSIFTLIVHIPVAIFITYILSIQPTILIDLNPLTVFCFMFFFLINTMLLTFCVSCIFYSTMKALTSCIIGWIVIHVSLEIKITIIKETSPILRILAYFVPLSNLCHGLESLELIVQNTNGWSMSDLFQPAQTKLGLSVAVSVIMSIFNIVLLLLILAYLDAVFPGPYGVAKPFYFIIQTVQNSLFTRKIEQDYELKKDMPKYFETPPKNAKVGLSVRSARKEYGFYNKVVAVDKVNLDIYENEIMVLLGHNGAGKTTTMAMITGMTAPTSGAIYFEGKDLKDNMSYFRDNLGFCPQYDMYFSKLNVIEHLIFFGMLKEGVSYNKIKKDAKSLLYSLGMLEKSETLGSQLSGGMKRRLCLAVSLVSNSKVLILDEPTSGLDPQTRRKVWDIILAKRGEHTVLITTHFMEEAEVLGDRIAIMDHGIVVCCGTSMFLKKRFSTGYHIHIVKSPSASVQNISNIVQQYVPKMNVKIISDVQVDYIIEERYVENFPNLFNALEKNKGSLEVTGITVTGTTMEDVFLKVSEILAVDETHKKSEIKKPASSPIISKSTIFRSDTDKLGGFALFCQRLRFAYKKRLILRKIGIISSIIKVVLLTFIMYGTLHDSKIEKPDTPLKPISLEVNVSLYLDTTVLMTHEKNMSELNNITRHLIPEDRIQVKMFPNDYELKNYLNFITTLKNKTELVKNYLFSLSFFNERVLVRYSPFSDSLVPIAAVNLVTNSLLRYLTNKPGTVNVVTNDVTRQQQYCMEIGFMRIGLPQLLVIIFGIVFIIVLGDFIRTTLDERTTGYKHQQNMAGLSPLLYWLVNISFDFLLYLFVNLVFVLIMIIFSTFNRIELIYVLIILVLQGFSGLSFVYLYSFLVNSLAKSLAIFYVLTIFFSIVPATIMGFKVMEHAGGISDSWFWFCTILFSFIPIYPTVMAISTVVFASMKNEYCKYCEKCDPLNVLKMPTSDDRNGILIYILLLIINFFIFWILIFLMEYGFFRKIFLIFLHKDPDFTIPPDTEEDVKDEIELVKHYKYTNSNTPLRVECLEKKYLFGPKAVKNVSFFVPKGECFGLLGVNGAGKSTTFKMLTAEILPDSGDAFVNELSVISDKGQYISSIGYCPQIDALLPSLTGEQVLTMIAGFRGILEDDIKILVHTWLERIDILEHANKRCGTYSGGMRRKLSMAMAMIGSPEIVFLDEPTTGVDPVSRRMLWTIIQELQLDGQAIVLTSHSMDECEVLCSRLTVMVDGRMECIGNVQYLKNKFGKGVNVLIKLKDSTPDSVIGVKNDFNVAFPQNEIKDEHHSMLHYMITDTDIRLSRVFEIMLSFKKNHKIVEEFNVSSTTLEEVFLSFAEKH